MVGFFEYTNPNTAVKKKYLKETWKGTKMVEASGLGPEEGTFDFTGSIVFAGTPDSAFTSTKRIDFTTIEAGIPSNGFCEGPLNFRGLGACNSLLNGCSINNEDTKLQRRGLKQFWGPNCSVGNFSNVQAEDSGVSEVLSDEFTINDALLHGTTTEGSSPTAFLTSYPNVPWSSGGIIPFDIAGQSVRFTAIFRGLCARDYEAVFTYSLKNHTTGVDEGTAYDSATFTVKNGDGPLIKVEHDIPVTKIDQDVTVIEATATATSGPCSAGFPSPSASTASINWSLGLGMIDAVNFAGSLILRSDSISPSVYTPASLSYTPPESSKIDIIRDANDDLLQIRVPQGLVDIVTIDATSYEIRFYYPDAFGRKSVFIPKVFPITGSPFETYLFEDPGASDPTLRITRSLGNPLAVFDITEFSFDGTTGTWSLSQGNGLEVTTLNTQVLGSDSIKTTSVLDALGNVISKLEETFQSIDGREQLVKSVEDPDGVALTTTWTYNPNGTLQEVITSSGSWERFEYDANGEIVKTVSQYLNNAPGSAENSNRVTEVIFGTIPDGDGDTIDEELITTVEKLLSLEVARQHEVRWSSVITENNQDFVEESFIQSQLPGAAWDASDNLVTRTRFYADGPFDRDTRFQQNPDGTFEFFDRVFNFDGGTTTTIDRGAPDNPANPSAVIDGVRTITTLNSVGNPILVESFGIATGLRMLHAITTAVDEQGRATSIDNLDGSDQLLFTQDFTYGCCGLESETDRNGTLTTFTYDALGRLDSSARAGISSITQRGFSSSGIIERTETTIRRGSDSSDITQSIDTFNVADQLIASQDAVGNLTQFSEIIDVNGFTVRTTTFADTAEEIETSYADGNLFTLGGSSALPVKFEYGVISDTHDGRTFNAQFTKEIKLGSGGEETEFITTYTDMLGQTYKVELPKPNGLGLTSNLNFFNDIGQLIKTVDPDGVTTLFTYDIKAERKDTAIDVDGNSIIDFSGIVDRITRTESIVINDPVRGPVRRTNTTVWTDDNAQSGTDLVSTTDVSLDGLQSWQTTFGQTTHTQNTFDGTGGRTVTVTSPDGTVQTSIFQDGRLISNSTTNPGTGSLGGTTFNYDPHGRVTSETDDRNGATTFQYYDDDQIFKTISPESALGLADNQTTEFIYDTRGRQEQVIQPDGSSVFFEYFDTGEIKKSHGSRTYPVEFNYDSQGRIKTMTTWQDFTGLTGAATTTWNYNPNRGLLISKLDNSNQGPTFTYTDSGRIETRTWYRNTQNIVTTFKYHLSGNEFSGDLHTIDYSDSTTDITFTYDRQGRQVTITDASGSRTLTYENGQLKNETYSSGDLAGHSVERTFDNLNRYSDLSVPSAFLSVNYQYDAANRLNRVVNGKHDITYTYHADSSLINTINYTSESDQVMATTRNYDFLNRLTSNSSVPSASPVVSYQYNYNSANQRTKATLANGEFWDFSYDNLGQVTSGLKNTSGGSPIPGYPFGYTFDDIGNRSQTMTNGRTADYTTNLLNQYSQREVPRFLDVLGVSDPLSTVTVNGGSTQRTGEDFYSALDFSVESLPDDARWQPIDVQASLAGAGQGGANALAEEGGNLFLAENPETFQYDEDGNLLQDSRWSYTWNAENRLIAMETLSEAAIAGVPDLRLEIAYDSQGRRFSKKIFDWNSSTQNYDLRTKTRFLYDVWNLIHTITENAQSVIVNEKSYTWGLDLSNTLQGAGGVGGLLAVSTDDQLLGTRDYFYAYDGNGNVVANVDTQTGAMVASYEYNPFGERIRASYDKPDIHNLIGEIGFSTKIIDQETEMVYYGFRYYNASTGRWLSRDPIAEEGGLNLYGMLDNDPVNFVDFLGLNPCCVNGKPINCAQLNLIIMRQRKTILNAINGFNNINQSFANAKSSANASLISSGGFALATVASLARGLFVNAAKTAPVFIGAGKGFAPTGVFTTSGKVAAVGTPAFRQMVQAANSSRNVGATLVGAQTVGPDIIISVSANSGNTAQRILDPFTNLAILQIATGNTQSQQLFNTIKILQSRFQSLHNIKSKCCK